MADPDPTPGLVLPRDRRQVPVVLTGRPLGDAIDLVIAAERGVTARPLGMSQSGYHLTWAGGIANISPLNTPTFLDVVVPSFRIDDVDVVVAATSAVRHLMDPSHPERQSGILGNGTPDSRKALQRLLEKRLTLSLRNVTVRQILNAIVLAHGGASWVVRYRSTAGAYEGCEIGVASFEGVMPISMK